MLKARIEHFLRVSSYFSSFIQTAKLYWMGHVSVFVSMYASEFWENKFEIWRHSRLYCVYRTQTYVDDYAALTFECRNPIRSLLYRDEHTHPGTVTDTPHIDKCNVLLNRQINEHQQTKTQIKEKRTNYHTHIVLRPFMFFVVIARFQSNDNDRKHTSKVFLDGRTSDDVKLFHSMNSKCCTQLSSNCCSITSSFLKKVNTKQIVGMFQMRFTSLVSIKLQNEKSLSTLSGKNIDWTSKIPFRELNSKLTFLERFLSNFIHFFDLNMNDDFPVINENEFKHFALIHSRSISLSRHLIEFV